MLPKQEGLTQSDCCCGGLRVSPPTKRGWQTAAGAMSLGVWLFMPKCPMCVAAYVAMWSGLGLSFAQAGYLRWSMLFASGAMLCYLLLKFGASLGTIRNRA